MTIEKKYWPIGVIVLAMFCAWAAWGLVYNKMSPFASPTLAIPLFYLTIFFALSLTFSAFSVLFRIGFFPRRTILHHVYSSLRQGVLFGVVSVGMLLFQQFHILSWYVAMMIIGIGVLTEAFFWETRDE